MDARKRRMMKKIRMKKFADKKLTNPKIAKASGLSLDAVTRCVCELYASERTLQILCDYFGLKYEPEED